MGYEVRAVARFPLHSWFGLAAAFWGLLALLVWKAPQLSAPPPERLSDSPCEDAVDPDQCLADLQAKLDDLPTAEAVEETCMAVATELLLQGAEISQACGVRQLEAHNGISERGALQRFVQQQRARQKPRLHLLTLSDRERVQQLADRAVDQYEAHLARVRLEDPSFSAYVSWVEARSVRERALGALAYERRMRDVLFWPFSLLSALMFGVWAVTRPVQLVISAGQVRVGQRQLALEAVDRWDFQRLSLVLTDGSRVRVGAGRRLTDPEVCALEDALALARERVKAAAPLNAGALDAVRKLAE